MLRFIGAAVVAIALLLLLGEAVGLDSQRAWVVNGLQNAADQLTP